MLVITVPQQAEISTLMHFAWASRIPLSTHVLTRFTCNSRSYT